MYHSKPGRPFSAANFVWSFELRGPLSRLQDQDAPGTKQFRLGFRRSLGTILRRCHTHLCIWNRISFICFTLRPRNLFSTMSIRPTPCRPAISFKRVKRVNGSVTTSFVSVFFKLTGLPENINHNQQPEKVKFPFLILTLIESNLQNGGIVRGCLKSRSHLVQGFRSFLIGILQNPRFIACLNKAMKR